MTALHIAVQQQHLKIVFLLIDDYPSYIDVDCLDSDMNTPLHYATQG